MSIIRKIYLYLFSLVGLVLVVSGSVQMISLGLRTFVFPQADQQIPYPQGVPAGKDQGIPSDQDMARYQERRVSSQRQRDLVNALAMIIVGTLLYLYHWATVNKEKQT